MLKQTIIILLIFSTIILFVQCRSQNAITGKEAKEVPKEQIAFDYPDNRTLTAEEKVTFANNIEKGKALYDITCAKCHNIILDGKSVPPDFSLPQLMDYEMRVQYPSHTDRLAESKISVEELDMVVDYLRYKKKNTTP